MTGRRGFLELDLRVTSDILDAGGVTAGNAFCDFPFAQQGSHPTQRGKRLIKVTSGVAKSVLLARLLRPGA